MKMIEYLDQDRESVLTSLRGASTPADAQQILGKGKANITAALTPASSAKITWTLAEGDELYATLKGSGSKAVLTAADVTGNTYMHCFLI